MAIPSKTMDSPIMDMTFDELNQEVRATNDFLRNCGVDASRITQFRPPYGELDVAKSTYLYDNFGLVTAMWNISPGNNNAPNLPGVTD